MEQAQLEQFKKLLSDEKVRVENELRDLGVQDPATHEWEAAEKNVDTAATEQDELADRIEALEESRSELLALGAQWHNINRALQTIENGSYGVCEIGGEAIELARLEANPSARTCIAHKEED